MGLDHIRVEIERMRVQIRRQRKDIQQLAEAGVSTTSADALLARMQEKVDGLCTERERLNGEERLKRPTYASGKVINGPTVRR
ncbi:hypothetical protein [Tardiphaga sp.]|uniref:hypothetical protein n=1 Tax=Tardiphaga sp. TaxID=1926292 RepID=UPI00260D333F|nr:hypothetical protein [Tardiphaga sp.]MDB5616032.1 hypothetical protein [Tardiphaga sp.]